MCIRLAWVDNRVSEESDNGDCDEGGVDVPVRDSCGNLLIECFEEDRHGCVLSRRAGCCGLEHVLVVSECELGLSAG